MSSQIIPQRIKSKEGICLNGILKDFRFLFPELHYIAWFLLYVYFHQSFSHGVRVNVNKVNKKLASWQSRKTKISQNEPFVFDAFVKKSKLPSLKDKSCNKDNRGQQEGVNATKTELRSLWWFHWNTIATVQ